MTPEARRQYLDLPEAIAERVDELAEFLERNPRRLPPWCEVKEIGSERGKTLFRARIADYRATFVFDGHEVKFTRIRLRKNVDYGALPKA